MIRGIIYCYTSPSGKKYIGQTINEKRRRRTFLNIKKCYSGKNFETAIDKARIKYSPENFIYTIIEEYKFNSKKEATDKLNEREIYYIKLYNTYLKGYNSNWGGDSPKGFKWTDKQKEKISGSNNKNKGRKFSYIPHPGHRKTVKVFDKEGNFIQTCDSIKEAAKSFNVQETNIVKVCREKLRTTGGYIFRYTN